MKFALSLALLVFTIAGCGTPHNDSAKRPNHPNILLVVADDLGYTDLGAFGSEIETPNLDALALDGLRFSNFHAGPSCAPTRAMLMSGTTSRDAATGNTPTQRLTILRDDIAPLPAILSDAGYRTYMSGKWDLGEASEHSPRARGFQRSFALLKGAGSHFAESIASSGELFYREDGQLLDELPDDFFSTRSYTNWLINALETDRDNEQPWFAYLAYTAPHWPLQVPENWRRKYRGEYDEGYDKTRVRRFKQATDLGVLPEKARMENFQPMAEAWTALSEPQKLRYSRAQEIYAAMVENMDHHVGRIVHFLEQSGELDNTVIMFVSDNGASPSTLGVDPKARPPGPWMKRDWDNRLQNFGSRTSFIDHGLGWAEAATAPFKETKGSLHEGGTRVAAFVNNGLVAHPGTVDDTYLTVMDILPTILEVAGTSPPGSHFRGMPVQPVKGHSFWGLVLGEKTKQPTASIAPIAWSVGSRRSVVAGRWKLLSEPPPTSPRAAQLDETALFPWRLFDLKEDPGELRDVSHLHPDITEYLLSEYRKSFPDALE